jgi:NAD(P)-dependent dehydrogenase (short-subunit alcohol dehydrogenase family)
VLLTDRVAIVSGIGPGMGRAIALACAREGADVVLAARTKEKLAAVASEVEAVGRRALQVPTDVTDEAQCRDLAAAAVDEFGRVDVLVNNAFVQPPFETLEDASLESWRRGLEMNLLGAVSMTRAVVPQMKQQHAGAIVFINSMSARRTRTLFGVYSAAKAALLSTARTFALELGRDGIRVNSVVPGYIWGPSVKWYFESIAKERGITREEVYDEVASETCLHHLPDAEEIADTVVFLASDRARAVTGQSLDVNAGHWFE